MFLPAAAEAPPPAPAPDIVAFSGGSAGAEDLAHKFRQIGDAPRSHAAAIRSDPLDLLAFG